MELQQYSLHSIKKPFGSHTFTEKSPMSSVSHGEEFTTQSWTTGGNRQAAARLITGSILISLFHLPPSMEAEGLLASDYFPKETLVCLPHHRSGATALLTFWEIPRMLLFMYQYYCVFPTWGYGLLQGEMSICCRQILLHDRVKCEVTTNTLLLMRTRQRRTAQPTSSDRWITVWR